MKKIFLLVLIFFYSINAHAWRTPTGVPAPSWGITTSRSMYLDCDTYKFDYGSGDVCYRTDDNGDPYTHYVDPSNPSATDTANTFGTHTVPRLTRPNPPFAAGTVLYLASGTYTDIGFGPLTGSGTSDHPIFITGPSINKPTIVGYAFAFIETDYIIIENLKFDLNENAQSVFGIGNVHEGARTNISIRNCEFTNGEKDPNSSYQVIRIKHDWDSSDLVQNIIIYNNYFHHIGQDRSTPVKKDAVGISIDVNSKYVWILDNKFEYLGGDGIQIASDSSSDLTTYSIPEHIYVGRNTAHDMYENFIDLKTCKNIIVSENITWNFGSGQSSIGNGTPFRYGTQDIKKGDQRTNVWTIFNTAYNVSRADGAFYAFNSTDEVLSDEIYFIGNIVYNAINTDTNDATAFSSWTQKKVYWINNTAYNIDRGFNIFGDTVGDYTDEKMSIKNNIIGEINSGPSTLYWLAFGALSESFSRSEISNNIFYDSNGTGKFRIGVYPAQTWTDYTYAELGESSYSGYLTDSANSDPIFRTVTSGTFPVHPSSPAVGNAASIAAYQSAFTAVFGTTFPGTNNIGAYRPWLREDGGTAISGGGGWQ